MIPNSKGFHKESFGCGDLKDQINVFNTYSPKPSPTPPVLVTKTITANGDYNASDDNADGYIEVDVNVPNTYTAKDEGKIVDNGTLVAQTAMPSEVTENGTIDTTLYNSVSVNVPSGGSGNDVIFYDYDGAVIDSYSATEFANLKAMPKNPTHEGLIAQGWNWSLSEAKSYVSTYGKLNIGQTYTTSDGKTRLYIAVPKSQYGHPYEFNLYIEMDPDYEPVFEIDWGDGSEPTIWSYDEWVDNKAHNYVNGGSYIVTITSLTGGYFSFINGSDIDVIYKIEFGSYVYKIADNAFSYSNILESVTIPSNVSSIEASAFYECTALKSVVLPKQIKLYGESFYGCSALSCFVFSSYVSLDNTNNAYSLLANCSSLTSITLPESIIDLDHTFENCYALSSIILPNGVTFIGDGVFHDCKALTSLIIPYTVSSMNGQETISQALRSITFKSIKPPRLEGLTLPKYCIIRVPQGTLSTYTSASNYPDPNNYIYVEY